MVEIRRGWDGGREAERLPWLEPVEDEDVDHQAEAPAGFGGVIVAAVAVLIGIALLSGGVIWYRRHLAATADIGQIIRAPTEPYKVRPTTPGGMQPDRTNEVAYGTSTGQDIDSPLDLSALPEAPVAKGAGPVAKPVAPVAAPPSVSSLVRPEPVEGLPTLPAPKVKDSASTGSARTEKVAVAAVPPPTAPKVVAPPAAKPEAAPAATGPSGTIQLGAFSTSAKAEQAWKTLSGRFAYLRGLERAVVPVEVNGATLYRLRASGAGAGQLCARLRVAGETCSGV